MTPYNNIEAHQARGPDGAESFLYASFDLVYLVRRGV